MSSSGSGAPGWDPADAGQRRSLLALLATKPATVTDIGTQLGIDPVPVVLQAIATELVRVSVLLDEELEGGELEDEFREVLEASMAVAREAVATTQRAVTVAGAAVAAKR